MKWVLVFEIHICNTNHTKRPSFSPWWSWLQGASHLPQNYPLKHERVYPASRCRWSPHGNRKSANILRTIDNIARLRTKELHDDFPDNFLLMKQKTQTKTQQQPTPRQKSCHGFIASISIVTKPASSIFACRWMALERERERERERESTCSDTTNTETFNRWDNMIFFSSKK